MFKRILVPTDGSSLARKAIRQAVQLALGLGASITGVYVAAPFVRTTYTEGGARYAAGFNAAGYKKLVEADANKALQVLERTARIANVPCRTRLVTDTQPWRGILRTARAARCDAIVMSTHGRSALAGLILGSETVHVLARSRIPVLVVR